MEAFISCLIRLFVMEVIALISKVMLTRTSQTLWHLLKYQSLIKIVFKRHILWAILNNPTVASVSRYVHDSKTVIYLSTKLKLIDS